MNFVHGKERKLCNASANVHIHRVYICDFSMQCRFESRSVIIRSAAPTNEMLLLLRSFFENSSHAVQGTKTSVNTLESNGRFVHINDSFTKYLEVLFKKRL